MAEMGETLEALRKEVGKWKNRAFDAANMACFNCEEYVPHDEKRCLKCRVRQILEDSGNENQ